MQVAPQHKVAQKQIIEIPKVLSSLEQNRDEEVTVFFGKILTVC